MRYRRDPMGIELVRDAARVLEGDGINAVGDCDDKCVLLATLLACMGYGCRFVAIGPTQTEFVHVYVEAEVGGRWVALDPTKDEWLGCAPVGWSQWAPWKLTYEIFD